MKSQNFEKKKWNFDIKRQNNELKVETMSLKNLKCGDQIEIMGYSHNKEIVIIIVIGEKAEIETKKNKVMR